MYRTLIECIDSWKGEKANLTFVVSRGQSSQTDYDAFFGKVKKVAGLLRDRGVRKGDRVVVNAADRENFLAGIWGAIYAGGCAVAVAYPETGEYIEGKAESERFANVLKVTNAPYILAGGSELENIRQCFGVSSGLIELSEESISSADEAEKVAEVSAEDPAVILFTSGSSGVPKGVELSHRKALLGCYQNIDFFELDGGKRFLNWLPPEHIASLMLMHMVPCVLKAPQFQVSTALALRDITALLKIISENKVNMSFAPNFAYRLMLGEKESIENADIDLSELEIMIDGGEAIDLAMTESCLEMLEGKGFARKALVPGWGMTELGNGAIYSRSFGRVTSDNNVAIGKAVNGLSTRLMKDGRQIVEDGFEGVLEISGECVLDGYLGESSDERAVHFDGEWFKTGDIAMMKDGELIITGRESGIFIINGENYSLEVIEKLLAKHNVYKVVCVRNGRTNSDELYAFACRADGIVTADKEKDIREEISRVYGFSIKQIIWLGEDEFPKTSIGKIDAKRLKEDLVKGVYKADSSESVNRETPAELSDEENLLLHIWADTLGIDKNEISVDDDFFTLGGNSVKVPKVIEKVELALGIEVKAAELVRYPTVSKLLEYIRDSDEMDDEEIDDDEMVVL